MIFSIKSFDFLRQQDWILWNVVTSVDGAVNLRQAVDSFLKTYRPDYVAKLDTKFRLGRGSQWLTALMPLLGSKRREIQSLAAFQFAMEASLRKGTRNLDIAGVVCLCLGIYLIGNKHSLDKVVIAVEQEGQNLENSSSSIYYLGVFTAVGGAVILIIAFLGCCGSVKEWRPMLVL
uniref:Uncharacterized protein n=1 Tax=Romanomermis culicivorax TaxID=13658 RepID=A0A915JSR5_ROMCU